MSVASKLQSWEIEEIESHPNAKAVSAVLDRRASRPEKIQALCAMIDEAEGEAAHRAERPTTIEGMARLVAITRGYHPSGLNAGPALMKYCEGFTGRATWGAAQQIVSKWAAEWVNHPNHSI